jgi:histidine triad (HIT) family protein
MPSIFTKIIKREIPAYIVAEDKNNIAFLDISPLVIGHTLVVPKKEVDYIYDLSDDEFINLHLFSKKVARAIKKSVPCSRVGITIIGLEVPHAHIHLIPINSMGDMDFNKPKIKMMTEQANQIANQITSHF